MSAKASFIKQATILACASLLVRLLGFLYRIPLSNMIGDEGNGIYSAGYYLYNLFLVLSSASIPSAISKLVSEKISLGEFRNANRIFKVALLMVGGIGFLFSLIMFVFAGQFCILIGSERSYYTILTLSPTIFIVAIMSVFRGYFQGLGTTIPTAMSQVVEQIFNAIFSVYLAYLLLPRGIEWGAAGGTAGTGVGALAGLIFISIYFMTKRKSIRKKLSKQTHKYKIDSNEKIAKKLLNTAVPIVLGTAIFSMTNIIDMKMVTSRLEYSGAFSSNEILSLYGQLTGKYMTLTTLPISISTAIATAIIPSIASAMIKQQYSVVKERIQMTMRISMIIAIPAGIGIGVLADPILMLLFPNYPDGGELLKIGFLSIIFLSLYQVLTGLLQGLGHLKIPPKSALIGCIIKIPIDFVLIAIPSINILGSVISTTVCYIVASILNIRALKKETKIKIDYKSIMFKPLIASLVMGLACHFVYSYLYKITSSNNLSVIYSIIVGIFVYAISLIMVDGIKREDLKMLPMGDKFIKILDKFNLL